MMDLRGIANGVTSAVNKNQIVNVKRAVSYQMGAGRRQIPIYQDPVSGPAQIQPADSDDLKQVDGLNVQGVYRTIFLRGRLAGVIRADGTGGDLVTDTNGDEWLVVKVLEAWPTWTKALICQQLKNV